MGTAPGDSLRELSVAVFGNAKMASVVLGIGEAQIATATEIAELTGIKYTLVRDVLQRLERAGLLESRRDGDGARAPLHYWPSEERIWSALVLLAEAVRDVAGRRTHSLRPDQVAAGATVESAP